MGLELRGRVTFPGQQLARTKSGTWPKFSWKYPKNDLIRETRTEARNLKHNSRKDGLLSSCLSASCQDSCNTGEWEREFSGLQLSRGLENTLSDGRGGQKDRRTRERPPGIKKKE